MGDYLARWLSASCAKTGRRHESKGTRCEDWVRSVSCGGVIAIALADGAGSARLARDGARLVVTASLKRLCAKFDLLYQSEDLLRKELVDFREHLGIIAKKRGASVSDFAATIMFVAICGDRVLAGNLGDGIVVMEDENGTHVLLGPQSGEFLNETVFVTSKSAPDLLRIYRGSVSKSTSFAVMSDGSASSLFLRRDSSVARGVLKMWSWLDDLDPRSLAVSLENAMEVVRQRTTDDCSIGLLRRVSLSLSELKLKQENFQRSFLSVGNRRGLATRLNILKSVSKDEEIRDGDLAESLDISAQTVKGHRRALRALFGVLGEGTPG